MADTALEGTRLVVHDTAQALDQLGDEVATNPSGCPGWTIKDLVAHMVNFLEILVDPSSAEPLAETDDFEQSANRQVAAKRTTSFGELVTRYSSMIDPALAALSVLESPPLANETYSLGSLGSYRLSTNKDALAFDHLVHVRHDMLRPRGPFATLGLPDVDEARAIPAIRWMLEGLPQMSGPTLAAALAQPVSLTITGPGETTVTLLPASEPGGLATVGPAAATATSIRTTSEHFMLWATRRARTDGLVQVDGDHALGGQVLQHIRVV